MTTPGGRFIRIPESAVTAAMEKYKTGINANVNAEANTETTL